MSESKKLIDKNISNIKNKLAEGKTLTPSDVDFLKKHDNETSGNFCKNVTELGRIFGLSRVSIYEYIKEGAPEKTETGFNLVTWSEWLQKNDKKKNAKEDKTIAEHRKNLVIEQTKKIKRENDVEDGKLIDVETAAEHFQRWAGRVFETLERRLANDFCDQYKTGDIEHNSKLTMQAIDEARDESAELLIIKCNTETIED
jgi:phage terminase Nu1 subunit (DNA packaging protein)